MKNVMSWIKIFLINVIVLSGLILTAEIGLRIFWTGYKCFSEECDFSRLSSTGLYNIGFTEKNIGISTYDNILGYKPAAGFAALINARNWDNKTVTIDSSGFRSNGNNHLKLNDNAKILAVGDSFTFGDGVSDSATWPSCLELKTNRKTLNAGVFGYGAAQAVRRASLVTQQQKVDTVILSVLVGSDFERDQLKFRGGFPRPAVIKAEEELSYADVPSIDSVGTKWRPKSVLSITKFIKANTMIGAAIIGAFKYDITGMRTEVHPSAASIQEIIKFSIDELSKLNVKDKYIVLQYKADDFPTLALNVSQIREQILLSSRQENIRVIDTRARLKKEMLTASKKIWNGHHTSLGNYIVCDEISKKIAG